MTGKVGGVDDSDDDDDAIKAPSDLVALPRMVIEIRDMTVEKREKPPPPPSTRETER
jgi:hypothetical protein